MSESRDPGNDSVEVATALERQHRELVILKTIAETLNASVDLEALMANALAQVAALLDLQTGWVFLLDEQTGEPYLTAAQNLPPGLTEDRQRLDGTCYCLETFRNGDLQGAANVNVVGCSRLHKLLDGTDGLAFHASIPLYARGKRLGVLNVASTEWRELRPGELRLLYTIGDMLGLAVERARLYARSLEAGAAEERNRLAREIHDTLAQGLAAITLQLETADALLEGDAAPERVREATRAALELARRCLEETRRSVLDLRAAPLEGRTLTEALGQLAEDRARQTDARIEYRSSGTHALPSHLEIGLYRIAQEALTNALRHAEAQRIEIALEVGAEQAELVIDDDGRGFDPQELPADRFGLIGFEERARLLNGRLRLESSPGVGTRVSVTVPVVQEIGADLALPLQRVDVPTSS